MAKPKSNPKLSGFRVNRWSMLCEAVEDGVRGGLLNEEAISYKDRDYEALVRAFENRIMNAIAERFD